jgi:antitoxin PrlF
MEGSVESAITRKGQATIPKAIRDHLHLKPGDRVKFFLHPDGSVVLLPKLPVTALRGMLKPRRLPVTIEDMNEAVIAGANADIPRGRRR